MDNTPKPSCSKQNDQSEICKKLDEMTTENTVLTPSVSMTELHNAASTGTIIHIPDNAGTSAFNMSMFHQFIEFMQTQNPSKRKRDSDNIEHRGPDGSKKTKLLVPDKHQNSYKEARNMRSKSERFTMTDNALKRYSTFEDHLVPKPMEVNILIVLTILLIKCAFYKRKILRNNHHKVKRVMSYFVFHRLRLDRSLEGRTRSLWNNGKLSRKTPRRNSWISRQIIAPVWHKITRQRPQVWQTISKLKWPEPLITTGRQNKQSTQWATESEQPNMVNLTAGGPTTCPHMRPVSMGYNHQNPNRKNPSSLETTDSPDPQNLKGTSRKHKEGSQTNLNMISTWKRFKQGGAKWTHRNWLKLSQPSSIRKRESNVEYKRTIPKESNLSDNLNNNNNENIEGTQPNVPMNNTNNDTIHPNGNFVINIDNLINFDEPSHPSLNDTIIYDPINHFDIITNNSIRISFFDKTVDINTDNKNERSVVNLSSVILTEIERSVLEKGLKFCPTPGEPDMNELLDDLRLFFRRMRLKVHFQDSIDVPGNNSQPTIEESFNPPSPSNSSSEDDRTHNKFIAKSSFDPIITDPFLEAFFVLVKEDLDNYHPRIPRSNNLTKEERESLLSLQSNSNLIIKKADKGSAVVLMDKDDYIKEAERQLSDTNFYVSSPIDLTRINITKIEGILKKMLDDSEINFETYAHLTPDISKNRTAEFYFLPKIHKKEVKGRPIISGNGCPTEKISAFVDDHIKEYVKKLPSYVKDTTDFIRKLESFSKMKRVRHDNELILVTMDVTSLYTNIPNHEGIVSVIKTLEPTYNRRVSLNSIKKLLTAVLHLNNFKFNENNYLQIGGTAMGTRLAPSYANLFMGKLEQKFLKLLQIQGLEPALYLRYIDDIFIIWDQGEEKLKEFINKINEIHPTIKFTSEYSREVIVFLDTKVKVDKTNKTVFTDLHTKDTDTQNYLHYSSSHPSHCKKGGPFGEFLRIRRNCHQLVDFEKHASRRLSYYLRWGYPIKDLERALDKARKADRNTLLTEKIPSGNKKERIPLILTFNPANPKLKYIINKHWHLVEKCINKDIFPEKPIIAYRRNKNLSDQLVRAKCVPHKETEIAKITHDKRCKKPWMCSFCPKPSQNQSFKSSVTGREYKGPAKYTCKTQNLIYLITCKKCKKQYVGETCREFDTRMKEHLRYIRNPHQYDEPTGRHFNLPGHHISDFNCRVIHTMGTIPIRNDQRRIQKEEFYIDQLKTRTPRGLNERMGRHKVR